MIDLTRGGDVFVLWMTDGENRWSTAFVQAFDEALDEVEAADARPPRLPVRQRAGDRHDDPGGRDRYMLQNAGQFPLRP